MKRSLLQRVGQLAGDDVQGRSQLATERIDGSAGLREGNDNLAPGNRLWWQEYRRRLQNVAEESRQV